MARIAPGRAGLRVAPARAREAGAVVRRHLRAARRPVSLARADRADRLPPVAGRVPRGRCPPLRRRAVQLDGPPAPTVGSRSSCSTARPVRSGTWSSCPTPPTARSSSAIRWVSVRMVGEFGVLRWDGVGWHHEPPLKPWMRHVAGAGFHGDAKILAKLLAFAVYDLGATGVGAVLAYRPTDGVRADLRGPAAPAAALRDRPSRGPRPPAPRPGAGRRRRRVRRHAARCRSSGSAWCPAPSPSPTSPPSAACATPRPCATAPTTRRRRSSWSARTDRCRSSATARSSTRPVERLPPL